MVRSVRVRGGKITEDRSREGKTTGQEEALVMKSSNNGVEEVIRDEVRADLERQALSCALPSG